MAEVGRYSLACRALIEETSAGAERFERFWLPWNPHLRIEMWGTRISRRGRFLVAELPECLAEDAHPDGDVGAGEVKTKDEAAEIGEGAVGGVMAGVLGGFEEFGEEGGEAFLLGG